ncbi:MAG: AMP-binding protein [Anaerolineales bacterium]|nr:AMP-binding protein [Anaerolineales bacterium]
MTNPLTTAETLNQALLAAMEAYAERPCLHVRAGQRFRKLTYRQFQVQVVRLVTILQEQGVTQGGRVALAAENAPEWLLTYVATLLAGGVIVPLRPTLHVDTLTFILQDTGARVAVLQTPEHVAAVAAARAPEAVDRLFDLQSVLAIGKHPGLPEGCQRLQPLLTGSRQLQADAPTAVANHARAVPPHALASIFYVPGDARPRGAVFEHGQLLARLRAAADIFAFDIHDLVFPVKTWGEPHSLTPTLHAFLHGVPTVAREEDDDTLLEHLQQTSPTVLLATPHSLELFYQVCMSWLAQQPESNQTMFQWALSKGQQFWAAGDTASADLTQAYRRAELTFFTQLRGQIGGRLHTIYATGASLPDKLTAFYEAIGIPVLNLYSLAETGGFPAASRVDALRPGTVGRATPGFELRIAADGEILVRSQMMMRGYWHRPEATQHAFADGGWFASGDLGELDEDGYLAITGRKQHVIVLSVGRKITPAPIEQALLESELVAETAVFGDNQPYLTALILPDLDAADARLPQEKPLSGAHDPRLRPLLEEVVRQVNAGLDQWEQIKRFALLDPANVEPGALAQNGRHALASRFAAEIAALYPAARALQWEEVSQVQVEPERLRALLEKESILDAWMADAGIEFLFDLARDKQIDAPSMIHISDIAATIAQIESEEKPLSTAILVGDPVRISHVLPESQVQLLYHDHIRRMRNVLTTLAKIVDGIVLGYVVDRYGYVRGIHKLNVPLPAASSELLGPQFRHHAAISGECDAIVFFVPYGGRQVRVFANGDLVGRYANGDWYTDNLAQLDDIVADLAARRGYDHALLRRILRVAFQMSEDNLGAIFMLGSADAILAKSDAAEISGIAAVLSADVGKITDHELINFAKQDGATVIDGHGRFRGCMVLLRPDASTRADVGPGKGARHSSAAKMSRETDCLAITVSQDGPITVYDAGKRILSL